MEQRRLFVFIALSMAIWLTWFHFLGPMLLPNAFPKAVKARQPGPLMGNVANLESEQSADALLPANVISAAPSINTERDPAVAIAAIPKHPVTTLSLGPADPNQGQPDRREDQLTPFLLAANLTSEGAAIDFVELTEKKLYPAFDNRGQRVKVLGSESNRLKTFALRSPEIDKLLGQDLSLADVAWEVVPEADPTKAEREASFRFVSPDQHWEIIKRFELKQLTLAELDQQRLHKNVTEGYEIKLAITMRNLTDQPQQLSYALQGPVGIPLEDAENSSKNRDLRMGFLRDDGHVDESKLSAAETVKKAKSNNPEISKRKLKYIGVDVLYFAALILPGADQVDSANAITAHENRSRPEFSDISVELTSQPVKVAAQSEVTHEYSLFAGPKRKELISTIPAIAVMDYGWFDPLCKAMVWLLNMFHGLGLGYGIAIICLTALVRTLLIPISKHQAANAAKMKVLQPKIAAKQKELEAKYGKNTDEYMRAAQELSKEQLGLMMSGCLPVFLQLPIFIALYRAIGSSIELRMVPFLWFENLASPDAIFKLPFVVPYFNWTHFNLLPCISTGLMFIHQKLTMPPPTNEEQAQQQKMMGFMMIFMGAMFFRVPSGLCLYFIATNVWSMTERWLFDHLKREPPTDTLAMITPQSPASSGPTPKSPSAPQNSVTVNEKPSALGGIWNRLQAAADTQRTASRQLDNSNSASNRGDKKKKKR